MARLGDEAWFVKYSEVQADIRDPRNYNKHCSYTISPSCVVLFVVKSNRETVESGTMHVTCSCKRLGLDKIRLIYVRLCAPNLTEGIAPLGLAKVEHVKIATLSIVNTAEKNVK